MPYAMAELSARRARQDLQRELRRLATGSNFPSRVRAVHARWAVVLDYMPLFCTVARCFRPLPKQSGVHSPTLHGALT